MANFTRVWDETFPPDSQPANQLGLDLRQLRQDARQRLTLSGNDADKPTNGTATETGLLYFALDTHLTYQWTGAAWVDVTSAISAGIIHSVNGVLNIPANFLQVGSLIELNSYVAPNAPVFSSMGFNIGSYTLNSGAITFAGGDFAWARAEVSVSLIAGGVVQFTSLAWGRASLAAGSIDFKLPVGGAFPDPTGIISVTPAGGTLSAKVFK